MMVASFTLGGRNKFHSDFVLRASERKNVLERDKDGAE